MDIVLQQAANAISLGGIYALLALGLAMIFSVLGMINFAHGDLMTIAGYVTIFLVAASVPFVPAALIGIGAAVAAAVALERAAFRPVRGASLATMLLSSFAVSSILHVLFQNFISPRPVALATPAVLSGTFSVGGITIGVIQASSIVCTAILLCGLALFLKRSVLGIAMRAAAQDFAMTRMMGFNSNRVIAVAFAISGLLAGFAGFLWVAQRGAVDPLMGFLPVLKAFIAIVIGGLGSLLGAVAGGFVLGAVEVFLRATLSDAALPFRDAIALSVVIAVLLWQPNGLLGKNTAYR